ncbi:MAG: GNAT family N-acetyltransferase [Hyphomicrobiaceae bacterium]
MTAKATVRLDLLADVPEAIDVLERWYVEEWEPWYGPTGQGDARADLTASLSRNNLPICVVALNANDEVLGTASLKNDSVGSECGVGPWLAAVLVRSEHRGNRIGTQLVEAIEKEAVRLGYSQIFTSTDTAQSILKRRGWVPFGTANSLRGPLTIYNWTALR